MVLRSRPLVARAAALGTLLALAVAGTASAAPSADIELHVGTTHEEPTGVPPTVCEFHLHVSVTGEAESGHWEIWTGDGSRLVVAGVYDAEPGSDDTISDPAFLTLEDGEYQLRWDNEPIDQSRGTVNFMVDCPEPNAAPTATPTPTPTAVVGEETGTPDPTATPGTTDPSGTATPRITLPPTDGAASYGPPPSPNALGLAALLLFASAALVVAVRPAAASIRVRRRR